MEVPDFKKGKGRFISSLPSNQADELNKAPCTDFLRTFTVLDLDDPTPSEEKLAKYRYIERHKSLEVLLGPPTDYPLRYKVEFLNNKCTVKMTLKSFERVKTKLTTFIDDNLAFKKFEFKTCVRVKGS